MAQAPKGIDVRQTSTGVLVDVFLQDVNGGLVSTGTTTAKIYEVQSDATLKSYDFNDNTFKTTLLTTETTALTHRTGNNGGTNTGYWSAVLSTLTGFTVGGIYLTHVNNSGAIPTDRIRKWQFGSAQGDLSVSAAGNIKSDAEEIAGSALAATNMSIVNAAFETGTAVAGAASSITLRAGAVNTLDYFKDQAIFLLSGPGAGQTNRITSYSTGRVATVSTPWAVQPTNATTYFVLGRIG